MSSKKSSFLRSISVSVFALALILGYAGKIWAQPVITPDRLDFGTQTVGFPGQTQYVFLQSIDPQYPEFFTYWVTGDFTINTQNTNCISPGVLAPMSACAIAIDVNPTTSGPFNGILKIAYPDASGNIHSTNIPLGTSAGAGSTSSPSQPLQVSPSSLNFGSIVMGPNILQVPQMITVTNVSNLPLSFFYTSNSNPDFVVDTQQQTCNAQTPLAQGHSCSILMSFNPSQPGPSSDSLTIAFSDTSARTYSVLVPLSGKGVASAPVAQCGNGTVEAGEECDDGNTTDGDGCSATCMKEVVSSSGQTPPQTPAPSAAAGGGCSMGVATTAQATSLLSLLPFGLVAFARVYRKK